MRFAVLTLLLAGLLAAPAQANDRTLQRYAQDTWRSFELMVDPGTGLPADNASPGGDRAAYTSPTNIAAYVWSTVAARDLDLIGQREAHARLVRTLQTLGHLERGPHGQFFNWYDPATGRRLTTWPTDGSPLTPFLSTVDNGWLAAALLIVARADPALHQQATSIEQTMDFGVFYDAASGHLYGGAWTEPPAGCSQPDGQGLFFTCHRYDTINTEPRIASYIGIAQGSIPPEHYYRQVRAFGPSCDWSWTETQPVGTTRTYRGVEVFEGAYPYRGMQIVPSWGGSMFEALMVPLLVPEEQWGPRSWGVNHPLYARAQIEHGLDEAHYGYWGFSPADNPSGGYREYGVDAIGMNPDGYASNNDNTFVDHGYDGCRPPQPEPTAYPNGVVTPHASFLALDFTPQQALDNLARLRRDFQIYGEGGFFDSVNVQTGEVARHWLALDQGMIMAAIANAQQHDRLQRYLAPALERAVRPLLAVEEFSAR
jgi:hypothetical protein